MDVSVIICAYNRQDMIVKCVDSVLSQNFDGEYEVIVIDDNSTDGTYEMIAGMKIQGLRLYKNSRNLGLTKTRNKGIALSRGKFVGFISCDCVVVNDWIQSWMVAFVMDQNIMIVGGQVIDGPAQTYWAMVNKASSTFRGQSRYVSSIIGCNMAYQKAFLTRHRFDEKTFYGDELDLCLWCCKEKKKIYYVREAILLHVHHYSLKGCIQQQLRMGHDNAYVRFKHNVFPWLNYGTYLVFGGITALILGLLDGSVELIFIGAGMWIVFLGRILLINDRNGCRKWDEALLTYGGCLLLGVVNCMGNVLFLSRRLTGRVKRDEGGSQDY